MVIIGLIVGGVLVGQDLINASEGRGLISDVEKFKTSAYTFRAKYNCKPGDCKNASTFGLGNDGNGNGTLWGGPPADVCGSLYHSTSNWTIRMYGECQTYFVHLSNAGLIKDQLIQLPNDTATTTGDDLAQYYPKLGKFGYMPIVEFQGRTYIRSGLTSVLGPNEQLRFDAATVSPDHMLYLTTKLDIDVSKSAACTTSRVPDCPEVFTTDMIPLGFHGSFGAPWFLSAPVSAGGSNPCITMSGSDPVYHSDGDCNFLWSLD